MSMPTSTPAGRPARCPRCGSRLRSDAVLFNETAPAYRTLYAMLSRARLVDALVVIGIQGNALPINEMVRAFPGLKLLNNLHRSEWIDDSRFDRVFEAPAATAVDEMIAALEASRLPPALS
jgi:NAD-dependent SIR2 family protein deacetylase